MDLGLRNSRSDPWGTKAMISLLNTYSVFRDSEVRKVRRFGDPKFQRIGGLSIVLLRFNVSEICFGGFSDSVIP